MAGIVAGDADKVLEVISSVDDKDRKKIKTFLENKEIEVCKSKSNLTFDLIITVYRGESKASVRISHFHTNMYMGHVSRRLDI